MTCNSCGFVHPEDFSYCPNCGAPAPVSISPENVSAQPVNTAAEKVLKALRDPLFLVLCILMSASCALHLIAGGLDILTTLFTVFFWLTYAQGRKGIADANHLRCISGTVYAHYILLNVSAVMLMVAGLLVGLAFDTIVDNTTLVNGILSSMDMPSGDAAMLSSLLASVSSGAIIVIFVFVGGLLLLINLLSIRRIHRFAKSVYQSILSGGLTLEHARSAYIWLYVFGIFSGLGILDTLDSRNIVSILSSCISCAMPIVAAILMKKHLMSESPIAEPGSAL